MDPFSSNDQLNPQEGSEALSFDPSFDMSAINEAVSAVNQNPEAFNIETQEQGEATPQPIVEPGVTVMPTPDPVVSNPNPNPEPSSVNIDNVSTDSMSVADIANNSPAESVVTPVPDAAPPEDKQIERIENKSSDRGRHSKAPSYIMGALIVIAIALVIIAVIVSAS